MVGGPNEEKHNMDYEFSKYTKDGLIFEFAETTDQDLSDIGAQNYIDKRNEVVNRRDEGTRLEGLVEELEKAKIEAEKAKENSDNIEETDTNDSGLTIKIFNDIEDKMTRGIAKKAFVSGERNKLDQEALAKSIESAVDSYGKLTDEVKQSIEVIRAYVEEDESKSSDSQESKDEKQIENIEAPEKETVESKELFSIKDLDVIEDKVVRGIAKKGYMKAKREKLLPEEAIDVILKALDDNGKLSEDIKKFIEGLG